MEKEVMDDVIEAAMAEAMAEAETEALNFKASAMVLPRRTCLLWSCPQWPCPKAGTLQVFTRGGC